MKELIKIALLGQPNCGKSTVFNVLTGSHQHTGNWPGKTVEKKEGTFEANGKKYQICDLPGSYSLSANSEEEIVTRDYVTNGDIDLAMVLVDASQMERSMFMLADYAGITTPAMVVLTMIDVAKQQGKKIDIKKLSEKLGVPVAAVVAPDKKSYTDFYKILDQAVTTPSVFSGDEIYSSLAGKKSGPSHAGNEKHSSPADDKECSSLSGSESSEMFNKALSLVPSEGLGRTSANWAAAKLMEMDEVVVAKTRAKLGNLNREVSDSSNNSNAENHNNSGSSSAVKSPSVESLDAFLDSAKEGALITSDAKFAYIEKVIADCVERPKSGSSLLSKFDRAAIGKKSGKWVSLGIVLVGIIASFIVYAPFLGIAQGISSALRSAVFLLGDLGVSDGVVTFINSTIVTSIIWVLQMSGFVFGVNFVFGLIEEVGLMSRISYSFDGTMNKLGLQGKSIMPMLMSFGCTIGGAAGTRVVDSWGQRILTIAVLWAIPCGATFAVIPTVAIGFFGPVGGCLVFLLIFAIMILHMWITSKIFGHKLNPVSERTGIIMELPPYHKPRIGLIIKNTFRSMWNAIKKSITVVLVITIVFYWLSYSPTGGTNSVLMKFGSIIEPVTRFFGMGWQTFIAFISSMISKEAVLGVFSALYSNVGTIYSTTAKMVSADAGVLEVMKQMIPKPEALAFMIAVNFNVPCIMAVSSTYQECHSMKWTLRIAGYYILSALIISCAVYHIAVLFF